MAHDELLTRHPLCTCPEATFTSWPDPQACRDRATARGFTVDPHPVLEIEDIRAMRSIVAGLYPHGSPGSSA